MTHSGPDRFDDDPSAYADYLRSPLGRLRTELTWAHLQPYLVPPHAGPPRALDVGAGSGELALRLAALGWHVVAVDRSPRMLERATAAAAGRGLGDLIECRTLDLDRGNLSSGVPRSAFDLVLCHNVLEYVDSPESVVREALQYLGARGMLSIVVRTRVGEILKHAIARGDLDVSAQLLTSSRVRDELYGLDLRLFDVDELASLLHDIGLVVVAQQGIRVVADYLPERMRVGEDAFERVLALERQLAQRTEFCSFARYVQLVATRADDAVSPTDSPARRPSRTRD